MKSRYLMWFWPFSPFEQAAVKRVVQYQRSRGYLQVEKLREEKLHHSYHFRC